MSRRSKPHATLGDGMDFAMSRPGDVLIRSTIYYARLALASVAERDGVLHVGDRRRLSAPKAIAHATHDQRDHDRRGLGALPGDRTRRDRVDPEEADDTAFVRSYSLERFRACDVRRSGLRRYPQRSRTAERRSSQDDALAAPHPVRESGNQFFRDVGRAVLSVMDAGDRYMVDLDPLGHRFGERVGCSVP